MDFLEKILYEKRKEIALLPEIKKEPVRATYSFYDYCKAHQENMQVIGEVKRASPSKGAINLQVDVVAQAKAYEKAGVAAISVLTDPSFFKGSMSDLQKVAKEVAIPVLCKDFIISPNQIVRACNAGATMILLIVAALMEDQLGTLYQLAQSLGMEVLVEVHNQEELAITHALGAKIIGVNNRNLQTFDVSLETSLTLADQQMSDVLYVSESGFRSSDQVAAIKHNYHAVLVGECLMGETDPADKIKELQVIR